MNTVKPRTRILTESCSVFLIIRTFTRRGEERFILVRSPDAGGRLKFAGGGVELGEDLDTATVREIMEEVGLNIDPEDIENHIIYKDNIGHHEFIVMLLTLPQAPKLPRRGETGEVPRVLSLNQLKKNLGNILPKHRLALFKAIKYLKQKVA